MLLFRKIEKLQTSDGTLVPLFKDWEWDEMGQHHVARMCYMTSLYEGVRKGPITHSVRTSIVTAIAGEVKIEFVDDDGSLRSISLRDASGDSYAVMIPPNVPVLYANVGMSEAIVLSLPDVAWHPNNDDSRKYDCWESYDRQTSK